MPDLLNAPPSPENKNRWFAKLLRAAKRFAIIIVLTYLFVLVALLCAETQLVYPGSKYPRGNWEPKFDFEDVSFQSSDGTDLHGWLMPNDAADSETPRYFLLCHGNAENVAQAAAYVGLGLRNQLGGTVFVFDYRGFGKSQGEPFEMGVKQDAARALDVLCERCNIQPSDVTLVGHSIGGGVATHLAATKGCKAMILQRTFNSLASAAQVNYPWAPVKLLMRNQFDSVAAIQNFDGPVYQSHGEIDEMIPIALAKKLFEQIPNQAASVFKPLPGVMHNDGFPAGYWQEVDAWLSNIESQPRH